VRDHRRALVSWCLGITAYVAVLAAIFPSIEGTPEFKDLLENYPDAFKSLFGITGGVDISQGAGFVDAEFFSLMLPLLAIVLAIGSGARTLAGEEDAGRDPADDPLEDHGASVRASRSQAIRGATERGRGKTAKCFRLRSVESCALSTVDRVTPVLSRTRDGGIPDAERFTLPDAAGDLEHVRGQGLPALRLDQA
jgi:hypothetical protein